MLDASYKNRSTPAYLNSLGTTLINYFRVTPGSLLVFFPSYTVLSTARDHWHNGTVWQSLAKVSISGGGEYHEGLATIHFEISGTMCQ